MSGPRRHAGSWRSRQEKDAWVQRARREGWRSRAVFKLAQIDRQERLLKPGMLCIDLGSAPGGWSQYVTEKLKGRARIIAVDRLQMDTLPAVEFVCGDFRQPATLEAILAGLRGTRADLVMSDMAPKLSGSRAVDRPRAVYLVELAVELCGDALKPGGDLVAKLFQGAGTDALLADLRRRFGKVRVRKPAASRPGSREIYLVARNYRMV